MEFAKIYSCRKMPKHLDFYNKKHQLVQDLAADIENVKKKLRKKQFQSDPKKFSLKKQADDKKYRSQTYTCIECVWSSGKNIL